MTQVVVDITHFTDGPQERGIGVVICTPFAEVLDEDHFVAVKPFTVPYQGAAVTIEVEELPEGNAWWFELRVDEYLFKRLVAPTGAGPVNLVNLLNLDPNTLTPVVDQSPAWIAALGTVNTRLDGVDADLATFVRFRAVDGGELPPGKVVEIRLTVNLDDISDIVVVEA